VTRTGSGCRGARRHPPEVPDLAGRRIVSRPGRRRRRRIGHPSDGPDGGPLANLPAQLDGQQAIRDYPRRIAASALRIDDLDTVAGYHTDDPEVLIVELVARATVTTTGLSFTARSIQVFRIRDGKILLFLA
jgi:hypothetical protein